MAKLKDKPVIDPVGECPMCGKARSQRYKPFCSNIVPTLISAVGLARSMQFLSTPHLTRMASMMEPIRGLGRGTEFRSKTG